MKKNIYVTGIICLAIIFISTIFKISHIQGAGVILFTGIGSMILVFLPIAYWALLKSTSDKLLRFLFTAALISFSVDFIGMLFKVQHWPGAGLVMIVGIPLPFILFLPAYIIYHHKRKLKTDLNYFAIILFMIYLGVFSALMAIGPNYKNFMIIAHSTNELSEANQFMTIATKNEPEITQPAKQLVKLIEEIKQKLLRSTNQDDNDYVQADGSIDYNGIERKELIVDPGLLNDAGLNLFNKDFTEFCNTIKGLYPNSNTSRLIDEIDDYRLPKCKGDVPIIYQLPLISILNVLNDWQNKLLLISYVHSTRNI
jgi:hypothetical protein